MKRTLVLAAALALAAAAHAAPPAGPELAKEVPAESRFTLTATSRVSFGAGAAFTETMLVPGNYACDERTFGLAFSPGAVRRTCSLTLDPSAAPVSYAKVSDEYWRFTLAVPSVVRFGKGTQWVEATLPAGTHQCVAAAFGGRDPVVGVAKVCEATPVAKTPDVSTKPTEPVTTPPVTTAPVNSDVSDPAAYRAVAATMGTDAGIRYRYGSPSASALPSTTYPGPRPNFGMGDLSGQYNPPKVFPDGVAGGRACAIGPNSWCGEYQIGTLIDDPRNPGKQIQSIMGWPGDYSSSIANVGYIPDSPIPAGFLEKRYHGVASLQVLNVGHGTVSIKPEPSWTTWISPSMNNADNDENTVRLAGVRGGSPIGTIAIDDKPVACQRGYGRGGWTNNVLCVFANGSITSAGSNTSHNFLKYQLPAGKTPTALAISNSGEFALITTWDAAALKGQIAVLALSDACQWCETKPESEWNTNWGSHRQAYPGLPGLGNYFKAKLIGFVDLPDGMRAPTEVAVTTGKWKGDYQRVQKFFDDHLLTEAQRKRFYDGDLTAAIPRTGMAVVISKSEKKAAFVDLRPLFQFYRATYLTANQSAWTALIASRGDAPSQWPYTFDVAPAQKPVVVKVIDLPSSPTAVQLSRNAPHRALIATMEGKLRVFDLGSRYLDQAGAAIGAPTDIAEKFTLDVGANPTSIAYFKEKAAFGKNGSLLYGREGSEERYWWALSREERKATLFQFDAAMNSAKPIRTVQTAQIADPIAIEDVDNHGTESHLLSVADYSGRQLHNVMYAPIVMWTYDAKAPCTEAKPCAPLNGAQIEYLGSHKLPGRPFQLGVSNIN